MVCEGGGGGMYKIPRPLTRTSHRHRQARDILKSGSKTWDQEFQSALKETSRRTRKAPIIAQPIRVVLKGWNTNRPPP